jgi:hypothetical protein
MNMVMKRMLARWLTIVAVIGVSVAPGGSPGYAGPCARTISIEPQVSAGEGAGALTFSVYSGGCALAGGVAYTVTGGTATASADYTLANGQLQWAAGDVSTRRITATIVPDLLRERDLEDFTIQLVGPSPDVRILDGTGQGRILDDDGLGLRLVVDDPGKCPPPGAHPAQGHLHSDVGGVDIMCDTSVAFSAPLSEPVVVHWSTIDGTAHAGVDFVGVVDQAQTVGVGATSVTLQVRALGQPAGKPSRSFAVQVTSVSTGAILDPVAIVTLAAT